MKYFIIVNKISEVEADIFHFFFKETQQNS